MAAVPSLRIRRLNDATERPDGAYVVYWMVAYRRAASNFALDYAIERSRALGRPLLVVETLKTDYPWASDRLHTFILAGMADNARAFSAAGITYHPYVAPAPQAGKGLIAQLCAQACCLVTDDYPSFIIPGMLQEVAGEVGVAMDAVDSYGLLPLRATDKAYPSAYAFRRALHKLLPEHLMALPAPTLKKAAHLTGAKMPAKVRARYPEADAEMLEARPAALARLPIDHTVGPGVVPGGRRAGVKLLKKFVDAVLRNYQTHRNHPDLAGQSGLSPYLHFGHVSPHDAFAQLAAREDWQLHHLAEAGRGAKEGFWGMSPEAEAFLDELVTWRELGANMCVHRPHDYAEYASLPDWAKATLAQHTADSREHHYDLTTLAEGKTDDRLWNAAQRQLREEGILHNYMRMLWGKRVLAWTRTPQEALRVLVELNNRYALDGRDPNSYAGIFWTLGRYDRPWPERPIFGKVRTMTSASTERKLQLKAYLQKYGDARRRAKPTRDDASK